MVLQQRCVAGISHNDALSGEDASSRPLISRLLAQPPRMGFQAVIKSAASAASLAAEKIVKK